MNSTFLQDCFQLFSFSFKEQQCHNTSKLHQHTKFCKYQHPLKKVNIFVYTTKDLKWWINPRDIGKCHKVSTKLVKIELQMELYALLVNGLDMLLRFEWLM